jgi:hypothetical protein
MAEEQIIDDALVPMESDQIPDPEEFSEGIEGSSGMDVCMETSKEESEIKASAPKKLKLDDSDTKKDGDVDTNLSDSDSGSKISFGKPQSIRAKDVSDYRL